MRKVSSKLTEREAEVLHLLTREFETPKQVAIRLKITDKRVYQIIKSLKKKGLITSHYKAIEKLGGLYSRGGGIHSIRLHAQQFHITPVFRGEKYKDYVNKLVTIDGNSVMVYRNSIEVYSNTFFFGRDVDDVTAESMRYWTRFFRRLENDFDCIILKPRVNNIKLVKQGEYAEINNELATEARKEADKIRLYTDDDHKLWFVCDNSFNMDEAETVHPATSKRDMGDVVKPFMNTLRNNPHVLEDLFRSLREIRDIQLEQAKINKETTMILYSLVELLRLPYSNLGKKDRQGSEDRPEYIG